MKIGWGKGKFSKELSQDFRKEHLTDAIGRTLECEDGIKRRVVEITSSYRYPWKMVINELDPESKAGHFINVLSFTSQMLGKPVPTVAEQVAFENVMKVRFGIKDDGSFNHAPQKSDSIIVKSR